MLDDRGAASRRCGQRRVELLGALGFHADVVQTWPVIPQKVTIDVLATDRREQLQLHVAEIAQRYARDEVRGLAVVAAAVRSEMDVRDAHPLAHP